MSTLGKVLLFLNLLIAGGLVYVAAQDWAKRQEINGVVVRYYLTLQGLPTEGTKPADSNTIPINITTNSGVTVDKISDKLFRTQFTGADGGATYGAEGATVVSLGEELERVVPKVRSRFATGTPQETLRFLVGGRAEIVVGGQRGQAFQPGLLMNLAESFEERQAIRALAEPPPATPEQLAANAAEATRRFNARLAALESAPDPKALAAATATLEELKKAIEANPADAETKAKLTALSSAGAPPFTRDDQDRRRRITLFLMMLDPSAAWQKRVMTVAGLKTYSASLYEQIARLTDMARQTERAIEIDQSKFEAEYELLKKLALNQDILVVDQDKNVKGLADMEAQDAASVAARKSHLADLNAQLASLRQSIKAVLDRQAAAEQAVFELQRKVGDALKGNLDLERKLEQAERN